MSRAWRVPRPHCRHRLEQEFVLDEQRHGRVGMQHGVRTLDG